MKTSLDQLSGLPDRIRFAKLSASANDFVVIDNRDRAYTTTASFLAQRLCARRYSIGADGLILIEKSDRASVRIRFINPDGNEFNTCGNGGRCAARYSRLFVVPEDQFTMETNIGVVDAEIADGAVKLKFVKPSEIRLNITLQMQGHDYHGHFVHVGDPHFVTIQHNIRELDFVNIARTLRDHDTLGSAGANIHFIEPVSRQLFKIRSFERGVEDETLACGSGCVSSAVSTFKNGDSDPPVTFEPHSGIPVRVHFNPKNDFNDIYLEGDARIVYTGELTKEALFGFP